ncbi:glycosyltransferase family 2 protein [Sphingopyxis panaciterrulae]|uniref:Glycosyltransferase 2-like domain-containing protein n=1 Tax=Sphingopyxis panaciterrulae TaxID=462372 RepID=A0A7W9B6U1_9SPHN|nr:glycosyltransferase [Sphingopyxis panaciterrulae]MBB5707268.1 hypothetical protein [Sphingopyxis panaciterrulae]
MTAAEPALAGCKLMVATAIYGGAQGGYVRAVLALSAAAAARGVPLRFEFILHEPQLHRARNMLTNIFLQSDCTHLLFVDDDIDFAAEDIFAMVAAMAERPECGILGAPVPRRMVNWAQVARAVDRGLARGDPTELARYTGDFALTFLHANQRFVLNEPVELLQLGGGFMLVGRDVLEALCARHAELVFRVEPRDRVNARVGEEVCGLFLPMIEPDSRLQLSEDYAFCHRARAAGFRIWLAPWVRTSHSGPATFAGSLADLAPLFSAPSVSDPE